MAQLNLTLNAHGFGVNMDALHLSDFLGAEILIASSTGLMLRATPSYTLQLTGVNFAFDGNEQLVSGTITGVVVASDAYTLRFDNVSAPANLAGGWVATDDTQGALGVLLAGDDVIHATTGQDLVHGFAGNDIMFGDAGSDTLYGGAGNDTIYGGLATDIATDGASYLRGEDGNDSILGSGGFDDINGNKGDDTIDGGSGGGDWLVGGQGDDLIKAHAGQNILYGNLGNDTLLAGSGGELMRGGQGNDSLAGGAGNDWLSGDRGNDTISGGAGADTFHTFSGAGIDRVLDFHLSEGDRVQLDPGTAYNLTQVGADTVIDMGSGDQMILVGVQMSTLTGTPGWIFTL